MSKSKSPAAPDRVRIAVLTDLHAYETSGTTKPPSWLPTDNGAAAGRHSPFKSLFETITRDNIKADIVVCCGDMTDKAQPSAQFYVWEQLQILKSSLGAQRLLATAGNHDVDSRYQYNAFDAKGTLQSLSPIFPIDDESLSDHFWARNFCVFEQLGIRWVILNSAAYHGAGPEREKEFESGRVSERTLERLSIELKRGGEFSRNVLICHHHPVRNNLIALQDYSEMKDGDKLINALNELDLGDWLIMHGHKHFPRIQYATGGTDAPVIFSAGSFSARLYPEYQTRARNEFYIVELHCKPPQGASDYLRGTISTWMWSITNGWQRPADAAGLPSSAGFGNRLHPRELAKQVADYISATVSPFHNWSEVCNGVPGAEFALPDDLKKMIERLKAQHAIDVLYDQNGLPRQLTASHAGGS